MKVTNRRTVNAESDYCIEFNNGTFAWLKEYKIVDCNDMLEKEEVNSIIVEILERNIISYCKECNKYMLDPVCPVHGDI